MMMPLFTVVAHRPRFGGVHLKQPPGKEGVDFRRFYGGSSDKEFFVTGEEMEEAAARLRSKTLDGPSCRSKGELGWIDLLKKWYQQAVEEAQQAEEEARLAAEQVAALEEQLPQKEGKPKAGRLTTIEMLEVISRWRRQDGTF